MQSLSYLAVGFFIALTIVVSLYSKIGALFCLALAYVFYRSGRYGLDEDAPLFPEIEGLALHNGQLEILSESEHELMLRGSEQVLILNRQRKTISGLYAVLASFNDVRHVAINDVGSDNSHYRGRYLVSISIGRFSALNLGCTNSQVDASIMAAKLSTWLGKRVIA